MLPRLTGSVCRASTERGTCNSGFVWPLDHVKEDWIPSPRGSIPPGPLNNQREMECCGS